MPHRHPLFYGKPHFKNYIPSPRWLSVILSGVLLIVFISILNARIRPIFSAMAVTQVTNAVTTAINDAITCGITSEQVTYDEMMMLEPDSDSGIIILSSNLDHANLLRARLLSLVSASVSELSEEDFSIPLGNLTDIGFLSGRGPSISFQILSTGAASAAFDHEFTDAGVNQTLHRIMLDLEVTVQVLLPGETLELPISTQVCVAETIIVGEVPGTYFELEQ